MILCDFNINNLFVRYKFGKTFPGDRSGKSATEHKDFGYLPLYQKGSFEIFNEEQRKLAALALTKGGKEWPDVICLQEVESLIALRVFNATFLKSKYPYVLVIDSRDLRQIDVGILSMYPIIKVRTHVDDETSDGQYIFSRDCLEVTVELDGGVPLSLFINHFKSKLAQGKTEAQREKDRQRANAKRKLQAETVAKIIRERFPGNAFDTAYFAVLGDFNDTQEAPELASIVKHSGLKNVFDVVSLAPEERWTHYYKSDNSVSQLDHILLSPALAGKVESVEIERRGVGYKGVSKKNGGVLPQNVHFKRSETDMDPLELDFQFKRFKDVDQENCASDHCPVFVEVGV